MNCHPLLRLVVMGILSLVMLGATHQPAAAQVIDEPGTGGARPADAPQAAPVAVDDAYTTDEDMPLNVPAFLHRSLNVSFWNPPDRATAGNMFRVDVRTNLIVTGFDIYLGGSGPQAVEIWYKTGTYEGFEQNPAAWTLLVSTMVESQGAGNLTYVPVDDLHVSALTSYAFYIQSTTTSLTCLNLALGMMIGNEIWYGGGTANDVNWGNFYPNKSWAGRLYYDKPNGVLANDSDADGDALTTVLESGPANGEFSFFPDGGFVYTPTLNFYGLDTFTYSASDGALTDTAVVSITVNQVDFPPVAEDDVYTTDEDTPLSETGIYTRSLETIFGGYFPHAGNMFDIQALRPITITGFDVRIEDAGIQMVEVWYKSGTYEGFEQDPAAWTLLGSVQVESQGEDHLTYVPIGGLAIPAGQTYGLYIQSTTSSLVSEYNVPKVYYNDYVRLTLGTMNSVNWGSYFLGYVWNGAIYYDIAAGVVANDADANGDVLTATLTSGPANGALNLYPDGRFVYTPTLNFYGVDNFSYMVTDGRLTDTAAVSITVLPVEEDPYVDAGADFATPEGFPAAFSGIFTDPDWRLVGESNHWDFGDGGTITGTYTPTHWYRDNGVFTVTLTVTDALNIVRSDWLFVTVENVAPLLTPISDTAITLGAPITITAAFTDSGLLDAHTLAVLWGDGLTETFDLSPGVLSLELSHTYQAAGDFTVTLSARDEDGGLDVLTFEVSVLPLRYMISVPMLFRE